MKNRLKKIAGATLLCIVTIGIALVFTRHQLIRMFLVPPYPFVELDDATKPDYQDLKNWLALPEKHDKADMLAAGESAAYLLEGTADVFFIHPTTYFGTRLWNDPLDGSGHIFEKDVTLGINASVFNACCRIFAPVFRQGTMFTYAADDNQLRSITFGAEDVIRAFDYYMENFNAGRPIIIAGHSQGADHGLILLAKRFSARPLRKKLIAAYLVGRPIGTEKLSAYLPDIPVCQSERQLGCILSWMTVGVEHDFDWLRGKASFVSAQGLELYKSQRTICTNPLTWTDDEIVANSDRHQGFYKLENNKPILQDLKISARCDRGALIIEPNFFDIFATGQHYHVHDYGLFYKNIRENAVNRTAQYLETISPTR